MNIIIKNDKSLVAFEDLITGDIFMYDSTVYMKIGALSNDVRSCICLKTGLREHLEAKASVEKYNAELILTEFK